MRAECRLPAEPGSVSKARRFVTEALTGLDPEVVEEIELMVSELATNCVIHAGTDFAITLTRTRRVVRIEITDGGSGRPTIESPPMTEPHGRGMRIVDQLATTWGVDASPDAVGKTLWFSLLVPA